MAIDSLADVCQPSYEMQAGNEKETPVLLNLLAAGWAVVVPDFEGPHYAYGAGPVAAHITLDGIRASEHFGPVGLGSATPSASGATPGAARRPPGPLSSSRATRPS